MAFNKTLQPPGEGIVTMTTFSQELNTIVYKYYYAMYNFTLILFIGRSADLDGFGIVSTDDEQ